MKKKRDKASLITTAVVVILCIFFVGGFAVGLGIVLDMEGTFPPTVNAQSVTAAPATKEEALDYLNNLLSKASEEKPKTETAASFSIDDSTFETDGSEQFKQGLQYVKDDAMKLLANNVETPCADYFEDISSFLRLPNITTDKIEDFTCEYIYYQCPSCEEKSDTPLSECEACGSERPYEEKWADNYVITLTLVNSKDVVDACFAPRTEDEYLKMTNAAMGEKAKLEKIDVEYTKLTIQFEVNRLFDEIVKLSYSKGFDVSFDAANAFKGEWSKFSGGNVKFNMTELFDYSFTWPHITLNEDYMTVEPKGNDNLQATLSCDNPTDYTVKWTVDDESIVTVDDEGYFKAGKNTGKTKIHASFEFGGKTYSDECEIEVKIPVERLHMNPGKVTLAVGEEKALNVKITPNDATIKDVTWYSEDESIASVDADGTVHASAPGKVTVYCLSDDGYYKSTCEVTVE